MPQPAYLFPKPRMPRIDKSRALTVSSVLCNTLLRFRPEAVSLYRVQPQMLARPSYWCYLFGIETLLLLGIPVEKCYTLIGALVPCFTVELTDVRKSNVLSIFVNAPGYQGNFPTPGTGRMLEKWSDLNDGSTAEDLNVELSCCQWGIAWNSWSKKPRSEFIQD